MNIQITRRAARERMHTVPGQRAAAVGVRFGVRKTGCSGYAYTIDVAREIARERYRCRTDGITVVVDAKSLPLIEGTEIDFARQGLNSHVRVSQSRTRPASAAAAKASRSIRQPDAAPGFARRKRAAGGGVHRSAASVLHSMTRHIFVALRREPAVAITIVYLFVAMAGIFYNYTFYRKFGIPVLTLSQVERFPGGRHPAADGVAAGAVYAADHLDFRSHQRLFAPPSRRAPRSDPAIGGFAGAKNRQAMVPAFAAALVHGDGVMRSASSATAGASCSCMPIIAPTA